MTIPFGLAGLGASWRASEAVLGITPAAADAIFILAALVWLVVLAWYLAQGLRQLRDDLRDPVMTPFVPVAVITPMLLSAALSSAAFTAGRVLVIIFLALTVVFGGWLTGQWIVAGDLDQDKAHPGYFLPTVAGGLAGAYAAAIVHLHAVAEASFGIGIIWWLMLGSTVLSRLLFRPAVPTALVPTLAIEMAPPALAGLAYFAVNGGSINFIASALGGYAVFMALVQLRFVPLYARLRFSPGVWAFTFSYAAAATDALLWIRFGRPAGATGYAIATLTLITVLIAAIAARTVIDIARGQFLPAPQPLAVP